ncbi:MAG: coiled coil domain-containing protein [Gammaproteobacteria bacterium]|nr:coiled coil domain-containing protein [Gammaproteobacteria bacterium]
MSKRQAYEDRLEAELDGWRADIDKLKAKADKADAEARIKYHEQIDELEKRRATIEQQLGELKTASDAAWGDIKSGAEKTRRAMSEALKSAASRF